MANPEHMPETCGYCQRPLAGRPDTSDDVRCEHCRQSPPNPELAASSGPLNAGAAAPPVTAETAETDAEMRPTTVTLQAREQIKPKLRAPWYWPPIESADEARLAAQQGAWVALFIAGAAMLFFVMMRMFPGAQAGTDRWYHAQGYLMFGGIILGGVAWGISRMSRVAAVLGLLYFAEFTREQIEHASAGWIVIMVAVTTSLVTAVRGTFAYRRFQVTAPTSRRPQPPQ